MGLVSEAANSLQLYRVGIAAQEARYGLEHMQAQLQQWIAQLQQWLTHMWASVMARFLSTPRVSLTQPGSAQCMQAASSGIKTSSMQQAWTSVGDKSNEGLAQQQQQVNSSGSKASQTSHVPSRVSAVGSKASSLQQRLEVVSGQSSSGVQAPSTVSVLISGAPTQQQQVESTQAQAISSAVVGSSHFCQNPSVEAHSVAGVSAAPARLLRFDQESRVQMVAAADTFLSVPSVGANRVDPMIAD